MKSGVAGLVSTFGGSTGTLCRAAGSVSRGRARATARRSATIEMQRVMATIATHAIARMAVSKLASTSGLQLNSCLIELVKSTLVTVFFYH